MMIWTIFTNRSASFGSTRTVHWIEWKDGKICSVVFCGWNFSIACWYGIEFNNGLHQLLHSWHGRWIVSVTHAIDVRITIAKSKEMLWQPFSLYHSGCRSIGEHRLAFSSPWLVCMLHLLRQSCVSCQPHVFSSNHACCLSTLLKTLQPIWPCWILVGCHSDAAIKWDRIFWKLSNSIQFWNS